MEKNRYCIMDNSGKRIYKFPFQHLKFSNIMKAREFLEIVKTACIVDIINNDYYRQDIKKNNHGDKHPWSGKTVSIISGKYKGQKYKIEDWAERVIKGNWTFEVNNPACVDYFRRLSDDKIEFENTLYGKIGSAECLINESEIEMEQ